ncbi:MAG: FhaA domain-containing protein [Ornithinimicrobium sp.]
MGVFDNLEQKIERAVKAPFAKVFKAEVQPVEIASHIRGAMDERAAVLGPGRTMVPNVFTVELASSDYERLSSYDTALTNELVAAAEDHADSQRYTSPGPMAVRLTSGSDLETGIFRVVPASKQGERPSAPRTPQRPGPRQDSPQGPSRAASAPPQHPTSSAPSQATDRDEQDTHTRAFPATPPPGRARQSPRGPAPWLEIDGARKPLHTAVTVLGRDESATIVIDDPGVSRRHAEIRVSYDGPHLQVLIRDTGSTNGTYLNGDQIGTEELSDGDRITVGRSTLTFHLDRTR